MRKIIITEDQYKRLIEQKWYNLDTSEYRQWIEDYGLNNKWPLSGTERLQTLINNLKSGETIEVWSLNSNLAGILPVDRFLSDIKDMSGGVNLKRGTYSGYKLDNGNYMFFYIN